MSENRPDTRSKAQQDQLAAVQLCRDVAGGTAVLRAKGETYLPQFPLESGGGYRARLATSVLFGAFSRTVSGLVGLAFRKDPKLGDDVPPEIRGDKDGKGGAWEDIDAAGTHGDVFLADRLADALTDGHVGIFVDMPVRPEGADTVAHDRTLALRPYWVAIRALDMLRCRVERLGGRQVLTHFAYRECVPDGAYGEGVAERVREYDLTENGVVCTIWRKAKDEKTAGDVWVLDAAPTRMTIPEIPLSVVYARRPGEKGGRFLESTPPLEDLAHENIRHYQLRSDRDNALHIAGIPIPWANGLAEGAVVKAAPDSVITLPAGSSMEYLEPSGASLESTRQELMDTEERMAVLGMSMLKRETRAAETAEGKRLDKAQQDSALARTVRSLQDGTENALRHHAMWLGQEDGGSINLTRDFDGLVLDPSKVAEYRNLLAEEVLSLETLWDVLTAGEWLPEGFDREEEKKRIAKAKAERPALLPSLRTLPGGGQPKPGDPPAPGLPTPIKKDEAK